MSMVDRLLAQLDARGLTVSPGAEPGQLVLGGPAAAKTPEVLAAVKAFKAELLRRVGRPPDPPPEPNPYGTPAPPRPYTRAELSGLAALGTRVCVLRPRDGEETATGEADFATELTGCVAASVNGGPWRRVEG